MQEIRIKPKTITRFIIGDTSYDVKRPTLGRSAQLEDELTEAKAKGARAAADLMMMFLEELGLPKSITADMEDEQLEQVIDALKSKKKP